MASTKATRRTASRKPVRRRARNIESTDAPTEIQWARAWRRQLRMLESAAEQGDENARGELLGILQKLGAPPRERTSTELACQAAAFARFYARLGGFDEGDDEVSERLARVLSETLGGHVSSAQTGPLLRAFRRARGERANGAPSREQALFNILRPLGHAQSVEAIAVALKRHGGLR